MRYDRKLLMCLAMRKWADYGHNRIRWQKTFVGRDAIATEIRTSRRNVRIFAAVFEFLQRMREFQNLSKHKNENREKWSGLRNDELMSVKSIGTMCDVTICVTSHGEIIMTSVIFISDKFSDSSVRTCEKITFIRLWNYGYLGPEWGRPFDYAPHTPQNNLKTR